MYCRHHHRYIFLQLKQATSSKITMTLRVIIRLTAILYLTDQAYKAMCLKICDQNLYVEKYRVTENTLCLKRYSGVETPK
jgi:hypothetical protein